MNQRQYPELSVGGRLLAQNGGRFCKNEKAAVFQRLDAIPARGIGGISGILGMVRGLSGENHRLRGIVCYGYGGRKCP